MLTITTRSPALNVVRGLGLSIAAVSALVAAQPADAHHSPCRSGAGIVIFEDGRTPKAWISPLQLWCEERGVYVDYVERPEPHSTPAATRPENVTSERPKRKAKRSRKPCRRGKLKPSRRSRSRRAARGAARCRARGMRREGRSR